MTDTTTQSQTATATEPRRRTTTPRPQVSVRPVAVGATWSSVAAGATLVAVGGPLALAAVGAGVAGAAVVASARGKGKAKANRQATGSIFRSPSRSALSRADRSSSGTPGGKAGSRAAGSGRPTSGARTGSAAGKPAGKGRGGAGSTSAGHRGTGGASTGSSGHRRARSKAGSGSRSPLTAAKVAAARRKLANRRTPGPRMSDAIRSATTPGVSGKRPTARQAWRDARKAVTGDNPKRRGTVRKATAGLAAASLAAGKAAWDARQRRKKRDAARAAKNARAQAQNQKAKPGVRTTVRQAVGQNAKTPDTNTSTSTPVAKPAPITTPPTEAKPAPTTGGNVMSARQLLAISEEFLAAAARNQPEGMLQVVAEAHLMPEVIDNFVRAMKIRYDRAQEHPLHASIKDSYGAAHMAQAAVVGVVAEIGPAIERLHKDELDKLRNPLMRGDEKMWDVRANLGGI